MPEADLTVLQFSVADRTTPHLHEPFLERASGGEERGQALGAFLTLRLVDRVADDPEALKSEAMTYQLRACMNYLEEIYPQTEENTHLREIVRVARISSESGNKRLLWSPMLAFAFWLEQQLRLDESLDVLDSALRLENAAAVNERIAANLQRGRVLRLTGRFVDAESAYGVAGELANLCGDLRSQMVSRIGRSVILQKMGDLPSSETLLAGVLHVAQESGDAYIEARALHGLAVTKHLMNRVPEAVNLAHRAYQKYDEPEQQARALSDVGVFLMELGHYGAAKEAFLRVLETDPTPRVRVNTVLELLEVAAHVQDRVGFERWGRELEKQRDALPPAELVDLEIKMGWGLAAFGITTEATARLNQAVRLAESHKLGQRVFEAEQMLNDVKAGSPRRLGSPPVTTDLHEIQTVMDDLCAVSLVQQSGP